MCEFISWIEHENNIYYIDKHCLRTKEGRELRKYLGNKFDEDIVGHGAIDRYWGLNGSGTKKECTDFSSPSGFPAVIVKALKNGDFVGLGFPIGILTKEALAEYRKIRQSALAEYEKIQRSAFWKIALVKNNRRKEWK